MNKLQTNLHLAWRQRRVAAMRRLMAIDKASALFKPTEAGRTVDEIVHAEREIARWS